METCLHTSRTLQSTINIQLSMHAYYDLNICSRLARVNYRVRFDGSGLTFIVACRAVLEQMPQKSTFFVNSLDRPEPMSQHCILKLFFATLVNFLA